MARDGEKSKGRMNERRRINREKEGGGARWEEEKGGRRRKVGGDWEEGNEKNQHSKGYADVGRMLARLAVHQAATD